MTYDYVVIGGGIVGLSTAMHLLKMKPDASLTLIDKEESIAAHQTGHNSGVIHAGIYYEPGSLKAELCREGLAATVSFCREHGIRFEQCGKLIVATNSAEDGRLQALFHRARSNGADVTLVGGSELRDLEPRIAGLSAILSPATGIVDYRQVARAMAADVVARGGGMVLGEKIDRIREYPGFVEVSSKNSSWTCKKLIVCGGLQADRLARCAGLNVTFRIVPFRGEYFQLSGSRTNLISHLIYPVPDPALPFLGIHLTRMIDGSVTVGPNAVLALAREAYSKMSFSWSDSVSALIYSGFWRLMWKYRVTAIRELKTSWSRKSYLAACQKYCPELTLEDLSPYPAGIRAQVVTNTGDTVHDFLFGETDRMLHVYNAPSPAATSAIPIGNMIAKKCVGLL